eukprot:CAMPEP_0197688206 /NCGR_PEP_ID=MMETSP1338-20131121/105095_1 /TAXON_ID=43686 ORGANISM="Pelagodinium beii, Strain RCC1491" /NCGR_SAMPLE_ID=MMETSP1338 /ASSEMBLY_ACC=CAM_ASM_000754 /LENGTH=109 /DNA_ID=CAMNT_0043270393 /DNA_START=102 /DNA_END=431 /DNA_ORIENTATION=-
MHVAADCRNSTSATLHLSMDDTTKKITCTLTVAKLGSTLAAILLSKGSAAMPSIFSKSRAMMPTSSSFMWGMHNIADCASANGLSPKAPIFASEDTVLARFTRVKSAAQ